MDPRTGLMERLKTLSEDDPLWVGLLWLLQANVESETQSLCAPVIGDEQAHRGRGRISALLDLREQLVSAWDEAHQPEAPPGKP